MGKGKIGLFRLVYDLFRSPLGLPINCFYEYIILAVEGFIAFRVGYLLAGRFGMDSEDRRILHWVFRLLAFLVLWALSRAVIWLIKYFCL